jgi:hypothetical protein
MNRNDCIQDKLMSLEVAVLVCRAGAEMCQDICRGIAVVGYTCDVRVRKSGDSNTLSKGVRDRENSYHFGGGNAR